MEKLLIRMASIITVVIIFTACGEKFDIDSPSNFQTETFKDFLWKKHEPVTIEAVLNTDFSETEGITKPLVLQLCDDDENPITPDIAQLYVNGEISEDNTISIVPDSGITETDIKIVLNDSQAQETRTFTWNLQVVDNPGLLKINDRVAGKDPWILGTEVNWKNKHVANSLKLGTDTTLIVVLIVIVVWILLAQTVLFTKFKVTQTKKIFVEVNDMRKNISGYSQSVVGAKEIVLTPESKSQSFLKNLFFGKVVFVHIKNLPGIISLTPGNGKFQTNSSFDRKKFEVEISGEENELKTIRSKEGDYSVEYYAKRK